MKKAERIVDQFKLKVQTSEEYARTHTVALDRRLQNFYAFVKTINPELMEACILQDVWVTVNTQGIKNDIDSKLFKLVATKIPGGEELLRQALDLSLNIEKEHEYKTQFNLFQEVFLLVHQGVTFLLEKRLSDAVRTFWNAHQLNSRLKYPTTQREDIIPLLKIGLLEMFSKATEYFRFSNFSQGVPLLNDMVIYLTALCDDEDPLLVFIRTRYLEEVMAPDLPSSNSQLEKVCEDLFSAEPKKLSITPYNLPKKFDLSEFESLSKRTEDLFRKLCNLYADKILQLKGLDIKFDFSIYSKPAAAPADMRPEFTNDKNSKTSEPMIIG
eukprot:TRINITY_DN11788_c0_g1_i1.p1 TRINITY_DN11788_c0_g1~~TRINITY_DN11788_c0_g1_i1.p1  ORF type:complete len:327 (+),score=45.61 TRINITY_DN11788_c0_g1_i1:43-1023(+)